MMPGMTADEHLKAINKRLEDKVAELEEEYGLTLTSLHLEQAKTERHLERFENLYQKYWHRCDELEQLCRDLYECTLESKCCNCEHYGWDDYEDCCCCRLQLDERMAALGIEVVEND